MAEENENKSTNEVVEVLKTPILMMVLVVFVFLYLLVMQFFPKVTEFFEANGNYRTQMSAYADKERALEQLKSQYTAEKANAEKAIDVSGKALFKPLESGLDTETIIASEFNEILSLITSNAIKTRSIKATPDPQDDPFIKGDANKFTVSKLDMEMVATYTNFKKFMQELYKHEHYLDIAKVEIVPYQKNKSILLINLQLKLYAEKV